jgi:hypothetical protein
MAPETVFWAWRTHVHMAYPIGAASPPGVLPRSVICRLRGCAFRPALRSCGDHPGLLWLRAQAFGRRLDSFDGRSCDNAAPFCRSDATESLRYAASLPAGIASESTITYGTSVSPACVPSEGAFAALPLFLYAGPARMRCWPHLPVYPHEGAKRRFFPHSIACRPARALCILPARNRATPARAPRRRAHHASLARPGPLMPIVRITGKPRRSCR